MVKFYIILILGLISSKTVPTHIIEAENFNTEETLSFAISSGYEEYALTSMAAEGPRMDVEIKFPKISNLNYNLTIYEFADFPLEDDIIQKNYANEPALITNFYEDENNFYYKYFYRVTKDFFYYVIYIFGSTTEENVQFDLVYSMNTDKYAYSDVMDINCNANFSLDTSIFPDGIIPDIYEMYFRVPVLPNKNITVTLTTNVKSDGNLDFILMFCRNSTKPDDESVKETNCAHCINEERFSNVYKYTIKTLNNTSYLSMSIKNTVGDLEYLNLYIDSSENDEKNFGKINLIHPYIYIVFLLILI